MRVRGGFFFKQKTAYEIPKRDWSSDVCSSDLDLSINMIEAGETGGILDTILQRISGYVEKAVKLKSAVKSALIYPTAVISLAVLIVGGLLKFVVPQFVSLFAGLGVELPLPTRIVMGLSHFVESFWWVVIGGFIAVIVAIKQ